MVSGKKLFLVGLFVSIAIAGFFSFYASNHPDGLQKVVTEQGLDITAVSANANSALAGYNVAGIKNPRLSGFLGGVIGVALVGIAGTGLYFWVRKPKSGDIK